LLGRAPGARAGLAGARILVVEDDKDCRELIRVFLERAAATVFCVDSVAAAMDCVYRSFDPDVVLTDYSMPVANGLEFIRQFRKAPSSRAIAVPIIVISGHSEENWRAFARGGRCGLADEALRPGGPDHADRGRVAAGRSGPHQRLEPDETFGGGR
jgi:sigma-B regulation protein RsbU (phosphoserine phosphatase)